MQRNIITLIVWRQDNEGQVKQSVNASGSWFRTQLRKLMI